MDSPQNYLAVIKVVGIGGGGVNAVNRMIEGGLRGVEFIAVNRRVDPAHIVRSPAPHRARDDRGLGAVDPVWADGRPRHRDRDPKGADMVFVTAGESGGTGTGGAPLVAEIARGLDALTIGVVTRPFGFEGRLRATQADLGITELKKAVDTLIVVPNDACSRSPIRHTDDRRVPHGGSGPVQVWTACVIRRASSTWTSRTSAR
jgi:cell division protein FtsZ